MKNHPLILLVANTSADAQALTNLLPTECRIEIVSNGTDALIAARHSPLPDLVLLDFVLADMEGLEFLRRIKRSAITRGTSVIFVSTTRDAAREEQALDMQAEDCIAQPYTLPVAQARIRNRLRTRAFFPSATVPANSVSLGLRQTEVLSLIAEGMTSAEIGAKLSIAKGTVEVHRENIMRKLDVHNIAGLVKYAIRHGLAHA